MLLDELLFAVAANAVDLAATSSPANPGPTTVLLAFAAAHTVPAASSLVPTAAPCDDDDDGVVLFSSSPFARFFFFLLLLLLLVVFCGEGDFRLVVVVDDLVERCIISLFSVTLLLWGFCFDFCLHTRQGV